MADKLYSSVPIVGAPAAALGETKLIDDHGNSVNGDKLTCGRAAPIKLDSSDWKNLHESIWMPSGLFAALSLRIDGEIPMLGDMESPLKAKCDKLYDRQVHPTARLKK